MGQVRKHGHATDGIHGLQQYEKSSPCHSTGLWHSWRIGLHHHREQLDLVRDISSSPPTLPHQFSLTQSLPFVHSFFKLECTRYHRNIVQMVPQQGATLWVNQNSQHQPRYGCSRHEHACVDHPPLGAAPCCIKVMKMIMEEMTRTLKRHHMHWR